MAHWIWLRLSAGLLAFFVTCEFVAAQSVYSNFRSAASAKRGNSRTATGGSSTGRSSTSTRWGIPGAPSRSDWTLNAPRNSGYRVSPLQYNAASSNRGTRHYVSRPPSVNFSLPQYRYQPRAYGTFGGPVIYGNGFGNVNNGYSGTGALSPYDRVRILNGLPARYSSGPQSYVGIVTPPIVIPYGGSSLPLPQQPVPVPHSSLYPSPNSQGAAPLPSQKTTPPVPESITRTFSAPVAVDRQPTVDEFFVAKPQDSDAGVSTVDRIRSLRYQTSGDAEFRKKDYAAAVVLFETASKTAPGRRAPWLRKAWAEVALGEYEAAVRSLKTALLLKDDPTSSWIPGEQLYGRNFTSEPSLQNDDLFRWLEARPNSTDRLLLAAAFQQLQGYGGTARELITAGLQKGLDRSLVDAFREIANDHFDNSLEPDASGPPLPPATVQDSASMIQDPNVRSAAQQVEETIELPADAETTTLQPQVFTPTEPPLPTVDGNDKFPLTIPGME